MSKTRGSKVQRRFSDNTATHSTLKALSSIEKKHLDQSTLATLSESFTHLQGYLDKKSHKGKWQRRYFETKEYYLTYRTKVMGMASLKFSVLK